MEIPPFLAQFREELSCKPGDGVNTYVADVVTIYCSHSVGAARRSSFVRRRFEVVPTVESNLLVVAGSAHDRLYLIYDGQKELSGPTGLKELPDDAGRRAYELDVYPPSEASFKQIKSKSFIEAAFWSALKNPSQYVIKGLNDDLRILVYSPHQFKVSITLPPLKTVKGGTKHTTAARSAVGKGQFRHKESELSFSVQKWNPWDGRLSSESEKYTWTGDAMLPNRSSGKSNVTTPVKAVSYSIDHEVVTIDVVNVIKALLDLVTFMSNVWQAVRDNVPKVGWYFDMDFQVMQGKFVVAWGWREHVDHRAYLWMGVDLDCTLFKLSLEIGVGVSGFQAALQVFGRIDGSARINMNVQRSSPELDAAICLPLNAEIKGTLGIRIKASIFARAEGVVDTAIQLKNAQMCFDSQKGLSAGAELWWTGIEARLEVSVGVHSSLGSATSTRNESVRLVDKRKLGDWKWPDGGSEPVMQLSRPVIRSTLKERLTDWNNVRVVGLTTDEMVDRLMERINTRRDIMRDKGSIDAVSRQIRKRLEVMEQGSWTSIDRVPRAEFEYFCTPGGQLDSQILNGFVDPAKELMTRVA